MKPCFQDPGSDVQAGLWGARAVVLEFIVRASIYDVLYYGRMQQSLGVCVQGTVWDVVSSLFFGCSAEIRGWSQMLDILRKECTSICNSICSVIQRYRLFSDGLCSKSNSKHRHTPKTDEVVKGPYRRGPRDTVWATEMTGIHVLT